MKLIKETLPEKEGDKKYDKKVFIVALAFFALTLSVNAQTVTNQSGGTTTIDNPVQQPTIQGGANQIISAIKAGNTNWIFEVHGLYASKLTKKYGGGVGAFFLLSQYVYAGVRVDYVNGGWWMPQGDAAIQLPLTIASWLTVTPLAYAGVGTPISGAAKKDGSATAITGIGAAVRVLGGKITKNSNWQLDFIGDREKWSGFAGEQYRAGIAGKISFP